MPQNSFEQTEADATLGSDKQAPYNQAEPVLPESNKQTSAKGKHEYGDNWDTDPVQRQGISKGM